MNPDQIMAKACQLLSDQGLKPELSAQAKAVIVAVCDAIVEKVSGRMKRPTLEEVKQHGLKIELPESECCKFFNFYESKDWKVGKTPMKLWTAAMANWKRTWQERNGSKINGNVLAIQNQTALKRVEDRIAYLRGQFPLTDEKKKIEWTTLKTEKQRLMNELGFKA